MATNWPRKTLDTMEAGFEQMLPRHPKQRDIPLTPHVKAVAVSGSNTGIVVRFLMPDGSKPDYFINPVAILHLAKCITLSAEDGHWDMTPRQSQQDSSLEPPTQADWDTATPVASFTSASIGPAMILNLALVDASTRMVALSQALATELFAMIEMAERAIVWWDPKTFEMLAVDEAMAVN